MKNEKILSKASASSLHPSSSSGHMSRWSVYNSECGLIIMLVLFRAANALLCRSLFVPDEHWQSLEVAYKMVFNRGYLSWEWQKAIRCYTHPLVFAVLYKALVIFRLDTPDIMAEGPRILQSLLAALGDLYVYKLAKNLFDFTTAKYALLCQLLSWFTFYCCTRTLSNSTETSLTPVILYYWMRAVGRNKEPLIRFTVLYLVLSTVSVVIRPTGAILWGPLFLYQLVTVTERIRLLGVASFVGVLGLCWSIIVDRCFYGQWVFTQLNFLKFNVLEGHSAMFGVHSWHWYLTQGLPTILYTSIPLFVHGVWVVLSSPFRQYSQVPIYLGVWLVFVHSFLKHKEFRFVYPLLPIAAVYVGASIRRIQTLQRKEIMTLCFVLLLLNIPMSAYFSLVHQRGGVAVMDYLRHQPEIDEKSSILFLMPCHSTPQYSLFHTNASLLFLHCDYDWNKDDLPYREGHFYKDPASWVQENVVHAHFAPSYIIMYDVLYLTVKQTLNSSYKEVAKLFHTHFKDNEKIGSYIIVLKGTSTLRMATE